MADFSSLDPLEKRATELESKAVSSAAAGYNLPSQLRSAISGRFNDSPLIKQRETAMQTFMTSPDRARESIASKVAGGTILSPTQQQAIVASQRAADVVPLASLNDLLKSQFGAISDLVGAGTGAYQAQVAADQGAAQVARQTADSALKRLVEQANLEMEQQKINAAKAPKAPSAIESMLMKLLAGGQGGGAATGAGAPEGFSRESKPTGIPSEEFVARISQGGGAVNSPGGQWSFNNYTGGWQPSDLPIQQYTPGTVVQDDQTGEMLTFTGSDWVAGQPQIPAPQQAPWWQQLFGGI